MTLGERIDMVWLHVSQCASSSPFQVQPSSACLVVCVGRKYNSGEYDKTVVFISVMEVVSTCFWY